MVLTELYLEEEKKVKLSVKVLYALLVLIFAFNAAGCSRLFGPSNEDAIKAINESGLLKSAGFAVTSPVTILEKGKQRPDGSWPVKVKLTVSFTMKKDGVETKQETETTPTFFIKKSKDNTGKAIWTATLTAS